MVDCYCDYDPAEVYVATTPKARKSYRCDECGKPIQIGDKYERAFGVWEGSASTYFTCERCFDLRQWVTNNVPCFCWAHGNMIDDAVDTVDDAVWRAKEETKGMKFGLLRKIYAIQRAKSLKTCLSG